MILYFENSRGERREIGRPENGNQAFEIISAFLKEHNFESYYTRLFISDDKKEIVYDVGSYTQFFYLYKEDGWETIDEAFV